METIGHCLPAVHRDTDWVQHLVRRDSRRREIAELMNTMVVCCDPLEDEISKNEWDAERSIELTVERKRLADESKQYADDLKRRHQEDRQEKRLWVAELARERAEEVQRKEADKKRRARLHRKERRKQSREARRARLKEKARQAAMPKVTIDTQMFLLVLDLLEPDERKILYLYYRLYDWVAPDMTMKQIGEQCLGGMATQAVQDLKKRAVRKAVYELRKAGMVGGEQRS